MQQLEPRMKAGSGKLQELLSQGLAQALKEGNHMMCLRECTAYRLSPQLGMLLALRRCTIANVIPCGVTHHVTQVQSHLNSELYG